MSKHRKVTLTDEQRQELEALIHAGNAPARTQTRARILLLSDTNKSKAHSEKRIAATMMCSAQTVHNVRHRFIEHNDLSTALYDQPQPGQAPKITGEVEAKLVAMICSDPPEGRKRWTLQLVADKLVELKILDSISDVAVMKCLKNELKPWRVKSWCIPKPSAKYVAKMEDVLAVYVLPYNPKRPVVCIDECSKELHSTPHGHVPMQAGQAEKQDYEYKRNDTCNMFISVEPLSGKRRVRVTDRRTNQDFAELLR